MEMQYSTSGRGFRQQINSPLIFQQLSGTDAYTKKRNEGQLLHSKDALSIAQESDAHSSHLVDNGQMSFQVLPEPLCEQAQSQRDSDVAKSMSEFDQGELEELQTRNRSRSIRKQQSRMTFQALVRQVQQLKKKEDSKEEEPNYMKVGRKYTRKFKQQRTKNMEDDVKDLPDPDEQQQLNDLNLIGDDLSINQLNGSSIRNRSRKNTETLSRKNVDLKPRKETDLSFIGDELSINQPSGSSIRNRSRKNTETLSRKTHDIRSRKETEVEIPLQEEQNSKGFELHKVAKRFVQFSDPFQRDKNQGLYFLPSLSSKKKISFPLRSAKADRESFIEPRNPFSVKDRVRNIYENRFQAQYKPDIPYFQNQRVLQRFADKYSTTCLTEEDRAQTMNLVYENYQNLPQYCDKIFDKPPYRKRPTSIGYNYAKPTEPKKSKDPLRRSKSFDRKSTLLQPYRNYTENINNTTINNSGQDQGTSTSSVQKLDLSSRFNTVLYELDQNIKPKGSPLKFFNRKHDVIQQASKSRNCVQKIEKELSKKMLNVPSVERYCSPLKNIINNRKQVLEKVLSSGKKIKTEQ